MRITRLEGLAPEQVSHNPEIEKRVMLRRGEVPHVTSFSSARLAPGQAAHAHSHADMHEVFYVLSGRGVIEVDGVAAPLEAGTCVAVAPGESHEIRNTSAGELVLLYFAVEV